MAMENRIKIQVKLNSRRLMLPVIFDDSKHNTILLTYCFKMQVDNQLWYHFSTGDYLFECPNR